MQKNRLLLNIVLSFVSQVVTFVCGFILPRYMLLYYGSEVNGLVSSISQFLSVIAFMQLGVGSVVQSALYKPLAQGDNDQVSRIFKSSEKFFHTIAIIFLAYVFVLLFAYPFITDSNFDCLFIGALILILAFNSFGQYYWGISNMLILYADQKIYVPVLLDIGTLIGNTIIAVVLITSGLSVVVVKLAATLIFLIRPLVLYVYVKKKYPINRNIKYTSDPIEQKWNGMAQHISSAVVDNTPIMILTIFSNLCSVSIYYVYNLIAFGLRQLFCSSFLGFQSYFGNLFFTKDVSFVRKKFEVLEFVCHITIISVFCCASLLIVPFVMVYTEGVNDADYNVPVFAYVLIWSAAVFCFRSLYNILIKSVGHYKQTQNSAIIEMIINLLLSIILVIFWGLVGVAIALLISLLYRLCYFLWYARVKMLFIDVKKNSLFWFADALSISLLYGLFFFVIKANHIENYLDFFICAIWVFVVTLFVCILIHFLMNRLYKRISIADIRMLFNKKMDI